MMAAAVVEECDHLFNEHGPKHNYVSSLLPPSTISRYFHLRENVVLKQAQCMVVEPLPQFPLLQLSQAPSPSSSTKPAPQWM